MRGWCVKKRSRASFDRRSFRWVRSGRAKVLVACPRGKWDARHKRCRVGTRAAEVLTRGACK